MLPLSFSMFFSYLSQSSKLFSFSSAIPMQFGTADHVKCSRIMVLLYHTRPLLRTLRPHFTSYIFLTRLLFTHTCPVTEFAVASHLNTANSSSRHVLLRLFQFQGCLPMNNKRIPISIFNKYFVLCNPPNICYDKNDVVTHHNACNVTHGVY